MRDYGNIPVLRWEGAISAKKASLQIHHAEPLVLQMQENFKMDIDAPSYDCKLGKTTESHIDCRASTLLKALAEQNEVPELAILGDAAEEAGQVVDIDTSSHRIIFHD